MLQRLTISHYALIEQLDINWMPGFSVITGETGAGKSIMLGALELLLGGRADAKAIQSGQKKCMVEASFSLEGRDLQAFFNENDIDYDPAECIVRREVLHTGKSRAFINDTPVTAARLKEIGAQLIDIHSQHKNLLIRNERFVLDTLDTMAAQPELNGEYLAIHTKCKLAAEELRALQQTAEKGQADLEYMQFQLNQIEEAALTDGEQEELEQEQAVLSHAEDIRQAFALALAITRPDGQSMAGQLRMATEALQQAARNYPQAAPLAERLHSLRIELDDIDDELERNAENIDFDPNRLAFVEERLSTIYSLEQKHHTESVRGLLDLAEHLRQDIDTALHADEALNRLKQQVAQLRSQRDAAARKLTASREKAARIMEAELVQALQNLGMSHVQIAIKLTPRPEPDASGADHVTFLFSANRNVPPQDVSEIASGGEIARLMLSIKALISRRTHLPSIIFDEIDTGVSGHVAERMAQMMRRIAESCQVICITHLPQIAASGEHHFRVFKADDADGMTRSHIIPLDEEERIREIAHMLSGAQLTEAAIENARTLCNSAHNA